jgi:hypothetical protein
VFWYRLREAVDPSLAAGALYGPPATAAELTRKERPSQINKSAKGSK